MTENKPSNNVDWRGVTKWIVIGVVLIVLIFVLKEPLGGLINRSTKVVINEKGVEILASQTAVGEVNYSQEKIKREELAELKTKSTEANSTTFVSENNYYMAWPKGIWKKDDERLNFIRQNLGAYIPAGYSYDMVCIRTSPSRSGFTPNVNVVVGPSSPGISMKEGVEQFRNALVSSGATILKEDIDEATDGALIVYTIADAASGMQLYYIQRFLKSSGKEYTITATTTQDDDNETKKELQGILNSFKIVE